MTGTPRQREAITTHDRSLVVTAGAGTGKTHVLVHKYLNLLETFGERHHGPGYPLSVQNILALTFTDKASAEMKERIRNEIEKKDEVYWQKTRTEFLIAPVQTFHSFCAQVLREFAFEAGLEPSFVVLDKQDSARILSSCFTDLIHTHREGPEGEAIVRSLAVAGPHTLEQMVRALYFRREDAEHLFTRIMNEPEMVLEEWQDALREYRNQAVVQIRANPEFADYIETLLRSSQRDVEQDDKLLLYLQKISPIVKILQTTDDTDTFLSAALEFCTTKMGNIGSKKVWGEKGLTDLKDAYKGLNEVLKESVTLLAMNIDPDEMFHRISMQFTQALGVTFACYCSLVDQEKAALGGMDFSDLIRHTRRLFREQRDLVAGYYQNQFRYILIDEFQDTDPAQFEIVTTIIGEPGPDMHSLFIVGDPKQSIYLFRDADVTRFRDAGRLITQDCEGKEIILDVCFRSTPAIISFVNILFSQVFRESGSPWVFAYNPIQVAEDRSEHVGTLTLLLSREDAGIREPEAVAEQICSLIAEEIPVYDEGERDSAGARTFSSRKAVYGDIVILLERRTNLGHYLHALATRNIPYYVHQGSGFYSRQEILDLINLLTALERPYDDIALFGTLRSPYFGYSDAELCRMSRMYGQSFFEKFLSYAEMHPETKPGCDLLKHWIDLAPRSRLVPLLRKIFLESGVLAVYGGMLEGEQILSNIEKLLEIVRTREEKGRYRLSDLVKDLTDSVDHEEQEGEATILDSDMNAVTIMTIHAAKGLEYPIVIVPEMGSAPHTHSEPVLTDKEGTLIGVRIPDPESDFSTRETPVYTLLKRQQKEKNLAEKRRLFYVALTRSSDHLIMSGEIKETLPEGDKDTRLDWILSGLKITGDDICAGGKNLRAENGEEVFLRIITPQEMPKKPQGSEPPFRYQDEERDKQGRCILPERCRKNPDGSPIPVTTIAERWYYKDEDTGGGEHYFNGRTFGTALHEVLRGKKPGEVIKEFMITDGMQQEKLHTIRDQFWSLDELKEVTERYHEMAFTTVITDLPVTGRIDLIVRFSDGGYQVIDFKSEPIPASRIKEERSYQVQLEIYRRAAEKWGMKPVRAAIYSVHEHCLIPLDPWTEEEIAAVMQVEEERRKKSGIYSRPDDPENR